MYIYIYIPIVQYGCFHGSFFLMLAYKQITAHPGLSFHKSQYVRVKGQNKKNSSWSMSMGFGFLYFSYKCLDNETILFFCKFLKQALLKALFVAPLLRVSGALAMKRNRQCINKTDISIIYTHPHIMYT